MGKTWGGSWITRAISCGSPTLYNQYLQSSGFYYFLHKLSSNLCSGSLTLETVFNLEIICWRLIFVSSAFIPRSPLKYLIFVSRRPFLPVCFRMEDSQLFRCLFCCNLTPCPSGRMEAFTYSRHASQSITAKVVFVFFFIYLLRFLWKTSCLRVCIINSGFATNLSPRCNWWIIQNLFAHWLSPHSGL